MSAKLLSFEDGLIKSWKNRLERLPKESARRKAATRVLGLWLRTRRLEKRFGPVSF